MLLKCKSVFYYGIILNRGDAVVKVISIKEPFATLISKGIKKIETRSWRTNYRGELFIHASGKSIDKKYLTNDFLLDLIKNIDMNYGNIICRCNLIDCIYMDEKFLEYIQQHPTEYSIGKYELGRYAWIINDVELIYPIPAKGRLNIWNFDGQYELINKKKKP